MGPVRQDPIQGTVRSVHMCVLCTVHNCCTQYAQNRPDNIPSYPPDNHHCFNDVYLREGGQRPTENSNSMQHYCICLVYCNNVLNKSPCAWLCNRHGRAFSSSSFSSPIQWSFFQFWSCTSSGHLAIHFLVLPFPILYFQHHQCTHHLHVFGCALSQLTLPVPHVTDRRLFNDLFSRTTWKASIRKVKPIWIFTKQGMTGWH